MKPRLSLLSVALTWSLLGSEQTTDSPPEKIGFHAVHVDRAGTSFPGIRRIITAICNVRPTLTAA